MAESSERPTSPTRVLVDAKIIGRHDVALPKTCFVGYLIPETGRSNAKRVQADESDDAEIEAILFAIEDLGSDHERLKIVCDHESVVSEANRPEAKRPSPQLERLRAVLKENSERISLEPLEANKAHGVVTEYANRHMQNQSRESKG